MAASVLLVVGDNQDTVSKVVEATRVLQAGQEAGQVGPVIDGIAKARVLRYIDESVAGGAELLVDGRSWATSMTEGNWIGPTIILHKSPTDAAMREEIFGPVLSIYQVSTWHEAIAIENSNPYGNAACVYTSSGGHAEWFTRRFRAGMLGVNVGIPVPREPFSFGGLYGTQSKYGDCDITGDGLVDFVTSRRKITSKWSLASSAAIGSPVTLSQVGQAQSPSAVEGASASAVKPVMVDQANFDGRM